MKDLEFHGTSREDLRSFPKAACQDAGYQLRKVQIGGNPDHWKSFKDVGSGVKEILISEDGDIFRVMYVAKFEDAVHVLHAFQKKTKKTKKSDIDKAKARYRKLVARS